MPEPTQVPTNGFPAVPPVPQAPPAAPQVPGNGNPIVLPGQVPGMLRQGQGQPTPEGTQTPTPEQTVSLDGIAELLRAALSQTPGAVPQTPTEPAAGWVPPNVNTFDVNSITDPTIKSMASILQVTGKDLDLSRAIGRAVQDGDPSLIDFAYIAEKGGANAAHLSQIAQGLVQAVAAKSESITREVHALVGGEAAWSQATVVFNQSAPAEIKAIVGQMLNSTNEAHIKAGAKIVAEFGRASGRIPQPGVGLLQNIAAGGAGSQGLSKDAFQAELRKLVPDSKGYEEARENLFARRSLGKRAGL